MSGFKRAVEEAEDGMDLAEEHEEDEQEGGDDDDGIELMEEEDGSASAELVNVDFEFFDPCDEDFHFIKSLLLQGFLAGVPSLLECASELADLVAAQKAVGTTIKVSDAANAGEVYSFVTALNIQQHSSTAAIKALRRMVLGLCNGDDDRRYFASVLDGKEGPVGWILNERIVNTPPQLVPPLHQCLLEDLSWAISNPHEGGHTPGTFRFQHFLLVAPCFTLKTGGEEKVTTKKKKGKKKKRTGRAGHVAAADFAKFEEGVFAQAASRSMVCQLVRRGDADVGTPTSSKPAHALVMLIPAVNLPTVVQQLRSIVSSSGA